MDAKIERGNSYKDVANILSRNIAIKCYFYRCDETRCECCRQNGKLINSISILTEDGTSRIVRVRRIALAKS